MSIKHLKIYFFNIFLKYISEKIFLESSVYKLNPEPPDLGQEGKFCRNFRENIQPQELTETTEIALHKLEELKFFKDQNFKIPQRNSTTLPDDMFMPSLK